MIEITDFVIEIQEQNLFSSKRYFKCGQKLHFDSESEMRLFFEYNVAHKKYIEIQGKKYEQVNSDNLKKLKPGEKLLYYNGKQYIRVRRNLNHEKAKRTN